MSPFPRLFKESLGMRFLRGFTHKYLLAVVMIGVAACGLPVDPRHTTDTVRGGTLRAGLVGDQAQMEFDTAQLKSLAQTRQAELHVVKGTTDELIELLSKGELDVVASLPKKTPYRKQVGLTQTFAHPGWPKPRVWAVRSGENEWLIVLNDHLGDSK